jgi:peptidoglycan/LPS O-acetylase OafA/YrhL
MHGKRRVTFPVFVLLVQRWRTLNVVVATVVVCAAFAYIGHSISIERVGYFLPFTKGIFGSCYEFLLGMMVCDLYVKGVENPVLRRKHSQLLLPGAVITVGALYLMHHAAFVELRILGNIGFAVGFALVLLSILSGVNLLRRVLEIWPLQVLGCMCYSIYAWHGIIMNEMIPPSTSLLTDTLRLSAPFLFVMLALSGLSYRYIEFGRERNWKALFLVADAAGAGAAMPGHTVPVRSETTDGEALRLERPGHTENIPVARTPDRDVSAQGTSSDSQLEPIASQTKKEISGTSV